MRVHRRSRLLTPEELEKMNEADFHGDLLTRARGHLDASDARPEPRLRDLIDNPEHLLRKALRLGPNDPVPKGRKMPGGELLRKAGVS
jgi:hypothetical protein